MKKTFTNITTYITLVLIIFSAGIFQLNFMHCVKSNMTNVTAMVSLRNQDLHQNDLASECNKCREERSCEDNNSCHKADQNNLDISNNTTIKEACCINYHILYKNEITGETPIKINSPLVILTTLVLHEDFNAARYENISKINQSEFADISPHPIIKQILKSIRQKSIQSSDEAYC